MEASLLPRVLCCALLLTTGANLSAQSKRQIENAFEPDNGRVSAEEFVVRVTGACETKPEEFATRDCIRGVTRQEFEQLLSILSPNATPAIQQKLAQTLGEIIILSNEAKKRELPKDPAVQQTLRFTQMQTLAGLLISQSLKKEADAVPDSEIDAYYRSHLVDYQTAELIRINVPQAAGESPEDHAKFADSLRSRCAAGEDPVRLQADADQHAGRSTTTPASLKNQRRGMLPAPEQRVFDLKPGECSAALGATSDLAIYKMIAMTTTPINEARSAIVKTLEASRLKAELEKIKGQNVISLNDKYFTAPPAKEPAPAK